MSGKKQQTAAGLFFSMLLRAAVIILGLAIVAGRFTDFAFNAFWRIFCNAGIKGEHSEGYACDNPR